MDADGGGSWRKLAAGLPGHAFAAGVTCDWPGIRHGSRRAGNLWEPGLDQLLLGSFRAAGSGPGGRTVPVPSVRHN